MTMPHLMNCAHQETGWCLTCVAEAQLTQTSAERTLRQLGYVDHGGQYWKPPMGKAPIQLFADRSNPNPRTRDLLDAAGNRYETMDPILCNFHIDDTALRKAGLEIAIDGEEDGQARMYWRPKGYADREKVTITNIEVDGKPRMDLMPQAKVAMEEQGFAVVEAGQTVQPPKSFIYADTKEFTVNGVGTVKVVQPAEPVNAEQDYWSQVIEMFVERLRHGPQTVEVPDVLALLGDCQYVESISQAQAVPTLKATIPQPEPITYPHRFGTGERLQLEGWVSPDRTPADEQQVEIMFLWEGGGPIWLGEAQYKNGRLYGVDGRLPLATTEFWYWRPLESEAAPAVGDGWQPMKTAPTDGRPVWVCGQKLGNSGHDWHYCWAHFDGTSWYETGSESSLLQHLICWVERPPAPQQQKEG